MVEGINLMANTAPSICLLGATGFLGSAIAKELDARGLSWVGISRQKSTNKNILKVDLFDQQKMIEVLESTDIIINALGSAKPKDFEANPEERLNAIWDSTTNLAKLIELANIKMFVNISSAGTVYGEYVNAPHLESSNLLPISWYGKAKVIEELYFENTCKSNDINYLCIRVTNPYGNDKKSKHGFIDVLLNSVISNKPFTFYEDCSPMRDFIYADDMAFSIVELVKLKRKGIFNLGSGEGYTLEAIADYVHNKLNGKTLISRSQKRPVYDVLTNQVNIQKLLDSEAYKNSMNVYKYIDNVLDNIGK